MVGAAGRAGRGTIPNVMERAYINEPLTWCERTHQSNSNVPWEAVVNDPDHPIIVRA